VARQNPQELREKSAALFNNCHLVDIVNTISQKRSQPFTTRQIATDSRLADSLVRPVIRRLLESGLIEPATIEGSSGRGRAPNYLRVRSTSGWTELRSLCRKLSPD
jgi:predicted transcriptional regulator